jgi:Dyp-type peroxidase family
MRWLDSIQGNIVKGHGREFTRLVFFSFRRAAEQNRALLPAAVAAGLVISAGEQQRQRDSGKKTHPFFSVAITEEFFWQCRLGPAIPPDPDWESFRAGMKKRMLGFGAEPETASQWDEVYRRDPHGMFLLAHAQREALDDMQRNVEALLGEHGAFVLGHVENGRRWSDDDAGELVREPFGFRDGISHRDFFAPDAATPPHVRIGLDRVIIPDGLHAGGSFLVLRKLDQNVKAFREFERAVHREYERAGQALPAQEAGALLVGRERDGTPLAAHDAGRDNDFDFEGDPKARVCPFHAHIRKANPRTGDATATDQPHLRGQFVRRSVIYDESGLLPYRASSRYPAGDNITGNVGLLFMGYMRDIRDQFERLSLQWFDDRGFPFPGAGSGDPMVRGPQNDARKWQWNGISVEGMRRFVTSRGGAYFYVPSMARLKNLAT